MFRSAIAILLLWHSLLQSRTVRGLSEILPTRRRSPKDLIIQWFQEEQLLDSPTSKNPLSKTVFCVPLEHCSDQITYLQMATNTRIVGLSNLQKACHQWDKDFQTKDDVYYTLKRVSSLQQNVVLIQWNVTWIPPNSWWLDRLAQSWPGMRPVYTPYLHLAYQRPIISYRTLWQWFWNGFTTGKIRIPLACIQGTTAMTFVPSTTQDEEGSLDWIVASIVEELDYARDVQQRILQNRHCANDLRLFLESGRRIGSMDEWEDVVATSLPWESVPGMINPLDIDPQDEEEGPVATLIFLGLSALSVVVFGILLAPELVGQ